MKTIRESYDRGVNARIEEGAEMLRLCVFIHGEPNSGKTYASEKALSDKRYLTIKGGGSGKFDNLRVDHEAIIIDDDVCPNLLNMTDNYICRAYKRQSNNPAWTGNILLLQVTTHLTNGLQCANLEKNIMKLHILDFTSVKSDRSQMGQIILL